MATIFKLKPFRFNLADLNFIQAQINFRPLFDAAGNAIINWDGIGNIFDATGNQYDTTGMDAAAAIAAYGTSYDTLTSFQGLRDVSGADNNLLLVNKYWGAVDQAFLRTVAPDFANYVVPNAGGFYGNKAFGTTATGNIDYTTRADDPATAAYEGAPGSTVIDYTPRMISRTITTGGAVPLQDNSALDPVDGGQVLHWSASRYATDAAYKSVIDGAGISTAGLIEGAAIVKDWGTLAAGQHDPQDPTNGEFFFGAINPGVAPSNSFLAYFGQFFDHGLDFIDKGAAGTKIIIPLATDDPLYRAPGTNGPDDPGNTRISVSRANVGGFDASGNAQWNNHTSPYIDQSQTYGSHAQMTSLLREWVSTDGGLTFHAGAHLLDGTTSAAWTNAWGESTTATLPTLNELRAHLVATGRDDLSWADVLNLRNRNADGDVDTGPSAGNSGQALLLDMNPHFDSAHFTQGTIDVLAAAGIVAGLDGKYSLGADGLGKIINFQTFEPMSNAAWSPQQAAEYATLANEVLLESVGDHYIAGDGRVNENVALTTIHHVFHEEHNFQVRNIQEAITGQDARAVALGDTSHSVLHDWQVDTGTQDAGGNFTNGVGGPIAWDEAKLFDAAKLTVEMEYQHAAVDQYARTITPDIPEFVGYNSGENATVSLEYAQAAFRFGHSTMRETIDYLDPDGSITGKVMSVALEQAFLNPKLFAQKGAAAVAMGLTHQQMNEIDELLTPAMNQGLLGQPLDLAAINIARGRDIGLPTLNEFREAVGLSRYTSWSDFGSHMVHPESLVNFIAAYSLDGDVARAKAIVDAEAGDAAALAALLGGSETDATTYAIDFLNGGDGGYNRIDTWIGGLAEVHVMGGLLGETFNLVFVDQINRLMDGDRFYYLYRLNNLNMGDEIANAQLKDIVERNTGLEHLNGSIFAYADQYVDLSANVDTVNNNDTGNFKNDHKYGAILQAMATDTDTTNDDIGIYTTSGNSTASNGSIVTVGGVRYIRDVRAAGANGNPNVNGQNLDGTPDTGANSNEVLIGTDKKDLIYMWAGDDTAYGEGGNDTIYGDAGIDRLYGGDGNDTIYGGDSGDLIDGGAGDDILYGDSSGTAAAGVDQLIGSEGNDIIYGGVGIDKLSGGAGDDVIFGGGDTDAFTHGGDGNDYIDGQSDGDLLWGDGGDDLIVGGDNQDIVAGLDGDDILRPGNPSSAMGGGPDEVLGGDGRSDAGNDGKDVGFDLIDFSDYVAAPVGATADFATQQNPLVAIDGTTPFPAWVGIEGLIGSRNDDTVIADDNGNWLFGGSGDDTFTAAGGNDVIVGDGIRLDSLIGTYSGPYANEFDGASHRAIGFIGSNGLLDQAGPGFDKHFTEMLKSEIFKDLELGGSTPRTLWGGGSIGDGGVAGTGDTVVLAGALADYTFERIGFVDAHGNSIAAFKVTDHGHVSGGAGDPARAASDGTDLVVGVEYFRFAAGGNTMSAAQIAGAAVAPVIAGGPAAAFSAAENQTAVATITATDATPGDFLVYSLGGVDAARFDISQTGALTFKVAPNFELPTDAGLDKTYDVVVTVTDSFGLQASQSVAVTLTDVSEAGSGAPHISGYAAGSTSATLAATSTLADPDLATFANPGGNVAGFQWQMKSGASWVNIASPSGLSGVIARVTQSYADTTAHNPATDPSTISPETAFIGTAAGNILNGTAGRDLLLGLAGTDTLNGFGGEDTLDGGNGNDTLNGGNGADQMSGGVGDDTYTVDNAADVVFEATGAGTDRVNSSIDYTLTDKVERLYLTGSAITGTGNGLDNILAGNLAANKLFGGAGNDTLNAGGGVDEMSGGIGNDIYYVDNSADIVIEAANAGNDRVYSGADFTLGDNVERLYMTGTAVNGTGNGLANLINGTTGHNVIKGGDGADVILGGGGDDDLYGEAGNDTFIFGPDAGHDTIFTFDADPAGGQDRIDLQTRGITADTFESQVSISASGPLDTLIQFLDGDSITIKDVASANIDFTDFKLLI
jgi:Ca2+-binding RTX toxin-like protein